MLNNYNISVYRQKEEINKQEDFNKDQAGSFLLSEMTLNYYLPTLRVLGITERNS